MIFGIILGITLGVAIGLALVIREVRKSNDLGDSKASFNDFSRHHQVQIISSADKVSKKKYEVIVHQR